MEKSQLQTDINKFEDGVDKILAENGANISGGQKLRVSLARLFYSDKDVELYDDPFSALDFNIATEIINRGILGSSKTRIIATHSIQYLKYADKILYIDEGEIQYFGGYKEFQKTEEFQQLYDSLQKVEEQQVGESRGKKEERRKEKKKDNVKLELKENKQDEIIKKYFIAEDRYEGRQMRLLTRLTLKYVGGKLTFIYSLFLCIFVNLCYYYAQVMFMNYLQFYQQRIDEFDYQLALCVFLVTVPNICCLIRMLIIVYYMLKNSRLVHNNMVVKVLYGDLLSFHDKIQTGRLMNRFSSDVDSLDKSFGIFYSQIVIMISSIMTQFYTISLKWSFLAIIFVFFLVLLYYQNYFIKINKEVYRLEQISKTPVINKVQEIIKGSVVFEIYGKRRQVLLELMQAINENTKNVMFRYTLMCWFNLRVQLMIILGLELPVFALICLFFRTFNQNYILVMLAYIFKIPKSFIYFFQNWNNLETQAVSIERCDYFLQIPSETGYRNLKKEQAYINSNIHRDLTQYIKNYDLQENDRRFSYKEINSFKFNSLFFNKGEVVYQNVFAKYPINKDYIIKDINFKLEPGMKLGICGQTGSGKTTIIKLIIGYLNGYKGKILIDGYDISRIDVKQLRKQMVIVTQDICLFQGTLLENLNPYYIKMRNQPRKNKAKK